MTRLSDNQLVILSAAAQRADLSVLPLPDGLRLKGGALNKVMDSLRNRGLIDHLGTPRGDDPPPLRITRAGLEAIGLEPEDESQTDAGANVAGAAAREADTGATSAGVQALETPAPATGADGAAAPAKRKTRARATPGKAARADQPTHRAGTKQALMIDLLRRPEGATVEQIAEATGWQRQRFGAPFPARSKRNSVSSSRRPARARSAPTMPARGAAPPFTGSPAEHGRAHMHGLLKQPGYRLHPPDSPEAEAVLAEVGVTRADLDRALTALERSQGVRVRSIVGINHDGVFGSTREGWHANLPDACKKPFVPLLWLQILELLGRVPEGSTARFLADGTLPD